MNARDEYLVSLEKELRDPLKVISFEDEFPPQHDFPFTVRFTRNAGTMSQRELFVLKNVMWRWKGELADIPPKDSDARLLVAVLYGGGKGTPTFKFTENLTRGSVDEYQKFYFSNIRPMSVDQAFQQTVDGIQFVLTQAPDTFFAQWCKAQLSGKPVQTSANEGGVQDSKIFTSRREPHALPLGRMPDGAVVSYTGNRALVTIAPPESGKSLSQALPALLNFAGHVFVLDIKGHFYEKTATKRRELFGSEIINFNPPSGKGAHYNPLLLISDHPDECWGDSSVLAELVIPIRNTKDVSWENMAQRLLALFIAYTVLTTAQPENRTMNKVLDLVAGIGTAEAMTLILSEDSMFPSAMQRAAKTVLKVTDDRSHAQFTGILQALETNLSIWNDPRVERACGKCDWRPSDFRGAKPVSVYFTIPLQEISTYAPLIRVITAQHVFRLMKEIPASDSLPILFLLDEFPQMGRMDPVRKAIEFGREYGIKTWLFAQFARQFEDTYGEAGKGLIDICGVRMFMNPIFKDAESISKEFGSQTNLMSEQKQPVMPPEEIIGPAHRNSVFVLSSNETPLVLSKNFLPR